MTNTHTASKVPKHVTLDYRLVAKETHVFTAREVPGLHISSTSLEEAFTKAFEGLSIHVSELFDETIRYKPEVSFDEFRSHLGRDHGTAKEQVKAKIAA